ncbi:hypothetical protein OAE77_00385 [bacterium]|nr:hypothetical protein [bacterium]
MIRDFPNDRTHERQTINHLRRTGHHFAQHDPGNRGPVHPKGASIFKRRLRLGIPTFLRRDRARQNDLNDTLGRPFFGLEELLLSLNLLQAKKVTQSQVTQGQATNRQPPQSQRANPHDIPP